MAKAMVVAGVMSGTSADGVDVAFCRVSPAGEREGKVKLLAHVSQRYPKRVREAVLAAMNAPSMSVADLSRLHWRLGQVYADVLRDAISETGILPQLIAMHGQTIYHQAIASAYAGAPVRATWQIGEASVVAEAVGVPVVSDFRTADLAAGGQGAPLVPMLDFSMFRHRTRNRVLLNLGGIANFTAIPAGARAEQVLAFDSGPANMVIDALMAKLFGKAFDRNGSTARRGEVLRDVLTKNMEHPFFSRTPPKSCGREEFGAPFAELFAAECAKLSAKPEDAVSTATAFTVHSLRDAYARFVWVHLGTRAPLAKGTDLVVAGGGARNAFLILCIREAFEPLGVRVMLADDLGMPSEAKEAAAFALLGWLTWHGLPGNLPAATGAQKAAVLGKVTCA